MPEPTPAILAPSTPYTIPTGLKPAIKTTSPVSVEQNGGITPLMIVLPSVSRYLHLLRRGKTLIQAHGRYTTYAGTSVFSRAPVARDVTTEPSSTDLAISLAAAQDCIGSAQPEGPARDDLAIFEQLWNTTLSILELITEQNDFDHETFGWGIYGLCAGYIHHSSWKADTSFLSLKMRLYDALRKMPSMNPTHQKQHGSSTSIVGQVSVLAKANLEVHICANLHLQQFRGEEWRRIRLYHGVAVAQRWIEKLGWDLESAGDAVLSKE
jgi:hypothetical protein